MEGVSYKGPLTLRAWQGPTVPLALCLKMSLIFICWRLLFSCSSGGLGVL